MLRPLSRCLGQQDHKLVAAETGKDVGASDIRGNGLRNRYQQAVADGMSQAVIDPLEIVQVDVGYCRGVPIAPRPVKFILGDVKEGAAIERPGQRVDC